MTNDSPVGVAFSFREMFDALRAEMNGRFDKLEGMHTATDGRVAALEQWRMLHEATDSHPRLTAALADVHTRLTMVEKKVGDEETVDKAQRQKQDRRMALFATVGGLLLVVVTTLGLVLPLLQHIH